MYRCLKEASYSLSLSFFVLMIIHLFYVELQNCPVNSGVSRRRTVFSEQLHHSAFELTPRQSLRNTETPKRFPSLGKRGDQGVSWGAVVGIFSLSFIVLNRLLNWNLLILLHLTANCVIFYRTLLSTRIFSIFSFDSLNSLGSIYLP